jgi:hypothetical protein
VLGFAVDHPVGWEVRAPAERIDSLAETWSVVQFRTDLYGYGHQAFGRYVVTVAAGDSKGRSLTDTVEYSLIPIVPAMREGIGRNCCLDVGGEPAMELVLPWPVGGRWGSRQVVVIHDGWEYRITFYPLRALDGATPSDAAARTAFDTFLRTFTFILVTATATPSRPTVTPVPTPAAGMRDGAGGTSNRVLYAAAILPLLAILRIISRPWPRRPPDPSAVVS